MDLKNVEIFKNIDENIVKEYLSTLKYQIKTFDKDEILFFRGDKVEGLYINLEGTLITEMLRDNGNTKKIEVLETGSILAAGFIFGNLNCFPVDIVAKTQSMVLFIPKKELLKLLIKDKIMLENFLDLISEKTQFLSKNLWNTIRVKTIHQKLAEYMLKEKKGDIVVFSSSIKELAEFFNISRPSLSRVIKDMIENEKISKIGKGEYKILDIEYLNNLRK